MRNSKNHVGFDDLCAEVMITKEHNIICLKKGIKVKKLKLNYLCNY